MPPRSSIWSPTRRAALAGAAALALPWGGAFAAGAEVKPIVLVILRGAMDGLAAVAPIADPHYRAARGKLALAPEAVLPLSDGFGLHPALTFLHERWAAGELSILHACATPYRERSHFDAQDVLESGAAAVFGADDGWLNRAIAALPPSGLKGLAIGQTVPLVLRGPAPASNWAPSIAPHADEDTLARLMDLYAGDALLGPALAEASATGAIADGAGMDMKPKGLGRAGGPGAYKAIAEAAARFMIAPDGPRAMVISFDGWDTHANQGAADGQLAGRLAGLDAALRALAQGLGPLWTQTCVVVATEFGRTVAANGVGGTDHGTGGAAFVLGGRVKAARFLGDWPGLAPKALFEGRDLAPVNDLRGLFAAVLAQQWGLSRSTLAGQVFPQGALRPYAEILKA